MVTFRTVISYFHIVEKLFAYVPCFLQQKKKCLNSIARPITIRSMYHIFTHLPSSFFKGNESCRLA